MQRFSRQEEGNIYSRRGNPALQMQNKKYGITDGLIRMNVGIENIQDIIADLDRALK